MKNLNYLVLAFIILFSSCRKEDIILEDPVVTQTPPVVVDGAFFSGRIMDTDGLAVETQMDVYQDGELVGTVSSDADGMYSTEDLDLELEKDITFAVENEDYANKYRRLNPTEPINENQNIRLVAKDINTLGPDNPLFNPGSADLVKIFGTFTQANGAPIQNADALVLYDATLFGPDIYFGLFDKTDENGYVEFLVPNDEEIFFYCVPDREIINDICFATISQEEVFDVISPLIGFDALGIVTEETEIIEQEGIVLDKASFLIIGELQNCDGTPVTEGKVDLEVNYWQNGIYLTKQYTTTDFDENGGYLFDFELCTDAIDVKITAETIDGFFADVSLNNIANGGFEFAPIKACDEDNGSIFLRSTMELAIGDDHFFDEIVFIHEPLAQPFNFNVTGSHPETGFVRFDLQNIVVGENPILQLVVDFLDNNPEPFSFSAANGELILDVGSIHNGVIDGSILGLVNTVGLGEQTINAKIKIQYE